MAGVRRRQFVLTVVVSLLGAFAPPATARVSTARLTFERDRGAELCPTPQSIREAVARRLAVDPFSVDGALDIHCTVSSDAAGLHARIAITDDPSRAPAERLLSSTRQDCQDLAEAIELALSIAINPRLALEPSAEPHSLGPTDQTTPVAPPPVPAPASPSRAETSAPPPLTPLPADKPPAVSGTTPDVVRSAQGDKSGAEVSLGVEALAAAGLGPGATVGAGVDVDIRRRHWSLELDARAVQPSSTDVTGGRVTAWVGMLELAPCRRFGAFAACAIGGVGAVRGHGEGFVLADSTTLPTFSVGARVAWERSLGQRWWLRASAELNGVVGRAHLLVDGSEAWVSPRINALLVLSGGSRFP
jgi:hypothetical protein